MKWRIYVIDLDDWQEGKKGDGRKGRGMNEGIKGFHCLSPVSQQLSKLFLNFSLNLWIRSLSCGKVKERNTGQELFATFN